MKVYLSIPITGRDINLVANKLSSVTRVIKKYRPDVEVVNPLHIGTSADLSWADNMLICLRELATCDAIIMLPGYSISYGCQTEARFAKGCNIKTYTKVGEFLTAPFHER